MEKELSFSAKVKEELAEQMNKSRHCQIAELAGLLHFNGKVEQRGTHTYLICDTDNEQILKKFFTLLKKTISINTNSKELIDEEAKAVLQLVKILQKDDAIGQWGVLEGLLIQQPCCKRAYIRSAFLSAGSISDPNKGYHFEIVCNSLEQGKQLQKALSFFEIDAKIVQRKRYFVLYLKEGAQIVDVLGVMEAHKALMELENVRILKEMRNAVNRKVNCETANIGKTVTAAMRQIEDIQFIVEQKGWSYLPDHLVDLARLRLEYPDMALKELGELLTPPVGKSGVNHRFRRISEIAETLRH